jgi:diaminohydroxyphosphoribosylaminopyrimidine deaminase/5-amino-6-(5-phosphoribosylamino)uracil reductase
MRAALSLARRGLGWVWPNPAVGCVIVADGRVVGRGWTQPGGRPHAETEALGRAGARARGGCAYVTLEPCNHHGRTPPCSDALLNAGIARVVTALEDPDPRVSGGGHERLRAGGVAVQTDVLRPEAEYVNAGFLQRVRTGRPLVTLKAATTLDGRIAAANGASKWITGPEARARGHMLRATHDAIMVGIGTALADAPELTCRLAGMQDRSPVRIVVDSRLRLPLDSALVRTAGTVPTWIVTLPDAKNAEAFRGLGVEVIAAAAGPDGRPDMKAALRAIAERGITRLLVEGGGTLAAALVAGSLVDRIAWFRAPAIMGGDGLPAIAPIGMNAPADMPRFRRVDGFPVGDDILDLLERQDSGAGGC